MSEAQRSTLFGVATGTPDGGVAVVRISGPRAAAIAEGLVGSLPGPRIAGLRSITTAEGRDEGLVVWMPGPGSFTGEDVVELHVHAGRLNVEAVCGAVAALGGRAAGPGDFSRRAFELGRLSLDQAEGVAAVIGARTNSALAQARRLAAGELGRDVEALRQAIVELQAEIEANLDFPEDVEAAAVQRWGDEVDGFARAVEGWLSRFEAGRRARSVPRVVVGGPVNAGKSSLFNALLGRSRALVSARAGTTWDYVEAELSLDGYACTLVDTAGLRNAGDPVERAGVVLTGEQLAGADLVLWVEAADARCAVRPPADAEGRTVILVETKRDLATTRREWVGARSVGAGDGVDAVRAALRAWFRGGVDAPWIGLQRHRELAESALASVTEAQGLLGDRAPLELTAFALSVTVARLGEITGRIGTGAVGEEVLSRIFARFCIGK